MTVEITCEACGHTAPYDIEPRPEIRIAEPLEDASLRGTRTLPISEPLDDE